MNPRTGSPRRIGIVERAYELACQYPDVSQIKRCLRDEGYEKVEEYFASSHLKAALRSMILDRLGT